MSSLHERANSTGEANARPLRGLQRAADAIDCASRRLLQASHGAVEVPEVSQAISCGQGFKRSCVAADNLRMNIREDDLSARIAAFARGAAGDPFDEPTDDEPDTLRARVMRSLDWYLDALDKSTNQQPDQQKVSPELTRKPLEAANS